MSLGMDYIKWLYSIVLFPQIFIYYHLLLEITPSTFTYIIIFLFHLVSTIFIYIYIYSLHIFPIFSHIFHPTPRVTPQRQGQKRIFVQAFAEIADRSHEERLREKSRWLRGWQYGYMVYIWSIYGLYMVNG